MPCARQSWVFPGDSSRDTLSQMPGLVETHSRLSKQMRQCSFSVRTDRYKCQFVDINSKTSQGLCDTYNGIACENCIYEVSQEPEGYQQSEVNSARMRTINQLRTVNQNGSVSWRIWKSHEKIEYTSFYFACIQAPAFLKNSIARRRGLCAMKYSQGLCTEMIVSTETLGACEGVMRHDKIEEKVERAPFEIQITI